jgi:LuxR family maltose regulon positive regulatory protein
MANSGGVLVQQGKLLEATVLFRRVIRTGDHLHLFMVQNALYQLGHVYLEWNMLDEAERTLRHADELAQTTRVILFGNRICLGLARLAWARGEVEDAFDEVERAINYAGQAGMVQHARDARALQVRFWLAADQLALARRWADSCELDPYQPPEYERQVEHLTYVRLLIGEERPDLALRILDGIQQVAEETGRHGDLVEILVLRVLAHNADGDQVRALDALEQALVAGREGGYVRTFADEGEALAPLLRRAAARGAYRDYAQQLLTVIEGVAPAPRPDQSGRSEALSEREVEVVRLVAAGLANREIGQRLFISEKTVKKHLSNILGKLGTTNRTQAVDQARRLDLLWASESQPIGSEYALGRMTLHPRFARVRTGFALPGPRSLGCRPG